MRLKCVKSYQAYMVKTVKERDVTEVTFADLADAKWAWTTSARCTRRCKQAQQL